MRYGRPLSYWYLMYSNDLRTASIPTPSERQGYRIVILRNSYGIMIMSVSCGAFQSFVCYCDFLFCYYRGRG